MRKHKTHGKSKAIPTKPPTMLVQHPQTLLPFRLLTEDSLAELELWQLNSKLELVPQSFKVSLCSSKQLMLTIKKGSG